ncbi:MAG: transposase [bacterium]
MRPPRPLTEEQKTELQECLKRAKSKAEFQRVQCVWLRALGNLTPPQIAAAIGWSFSRVKQIQGRYFQEGPAAFQGSGRGGRRRENLTPAEEEALLADFRKKAQHGGILVVSEIQAAYEQAVGHPVPKSTVYRMLARQGWRKIAPRHPRSDIQAPEAWKKNSPAGSPKKSAAKRKRDAPSA